MLQLTTDEICARLRAGGPLEAVASDTGCAIRVRSWVPHIATAIHAGSRMPHELEIRSALNAFERWQEEDPDTDTFIADLPIVLVGLDSRYAYDLNRAPEAAVYDEAWGKKVWLRPPTRAERKRMLERHARFLSIAETLAAEAVRRFGAAIVYDIHSYNGHRWGRPVPTFNLGTERIDRGWDPEVDSFRAHLSRIALPEPLEASTAVNDVFAGRTSRPLFQGVACSPPRCARCTATSEPARGTPRWWRRFGRDWARPLPPMPRSSRRATPGPHPELQPAAPRLKASNLRPLPSIAPCTASCATSKSCAT
jgi:hypothetical protein